MVVEQASKDPRLGPVGLVGIHWPAVWWPDGPAVGPTGPRVGDVLTVPTASGTAASAAPRPTGAELASALREGFVDPNRRAAVTRLGELADEGLAAVAAAEPDAAQRERLAEFNRLLATMRPDGPLAVEDAGEGAFLDEDDPDTYIALARSFGGVAGGGDAQGIGDRFRAVWEGAKDGLRVLSYYTMKSRAGDVGSKGLSPFLIQLHERPGTSGVRVHLVGHSFGGRLVSFALAGIPSASASPVSSLVLLQAAFSHFAFSTAKDNPFGAEGALRTFADRVRGPLVATWSEHDWAVGRWYPKASALARQDNQDNPTVSRWGSLGADGFQAVESMNPLDLLPAGEAYDLQPGGFYSVDGSAVIADEHLSTFSGAHSDLRHPEVAWLIAAAAGAGAAADH